MNQKQVIEVINKLTGRELSLSPMYEKMNSWREWLEGTVEGFYEYSMTVDVVDHTTAKIKRHKTDMFKRACEDWASLLLNELTRFELDDKPSEEWLQGEGGGVLAENDFHRNANELVLVSRWAGTAAFEVFVEEMGVREDTASLVDGKGVGINYLAGDQIVPISWRNGVLKEAAFVSDRIVGGKKGQAVSMHTIDPITGLFTITSLALDSDGKIVGDPVTVHTGSPVPWFAIIRKSGYNRWDSASPFGASILDGNEDVLKGLDTAFDNFIVDFMLGRKMVFMNSSLFERDDNGGFVAPQMMGTQLFINIGDKLKGDSSMLEEYNPALRVAENAEGVQKMLDIFSFKIGLGRGYYKLDENSLVKTATEYTGSKQFLIQNVAKEMIGIERALKTLVKALLWIGENVLHVPGVKADAEVNVIADDGYITDEYTERKVWQEEVAQGLRSKAEYRKRFMGESDGEAKLAIDNIRSESPVLTDLLSTQLENEENA